MAASKLQLMNVALIRIGATPITSETEGTNEQKVVVALWDVVRRSCLREGTWSWAIQDVQLAPVLTNPSLIFQHAYQVPSDCVRLLEVYNTGTYKLVGRKVFSDSNVCKLKYVKDIEDPTEWDPAFADAVAQRLAAEIAFTLTKSQATADSMWVLYDRKLRAARHLDSMEDVSDEIGSGYNSIMAARY